MEISRIIKHPRITEKGSRLQENNAYVFQIAKGAGKNEIKRAIFRLYKVKPIRVNVLTVPEKKINSRGRVGVKTGGRKAVVYLKEGDKIEFV